MSNERAKKEEMARLIAWHTRYNRDTVDKFKSENEGLLAVRGAGSGIALFNDGVYHLFDTINDMATLEYMYNKIRDEGCTVVGVIDTSAKKL